MQTKRNFCLHISQFLLHQLIGRERSTKLTSLQRVVSCSMPTEFSRTHTAPGNPVTGTIKASKWPLDALDASQ